MADGNKGGDAVLAYAVEKEASGAGVREDVLKTLF